MTKKYLLIIGALLVILASCTDYLDTRRTSEFGDEFTWTIGKKAEGVLLNAYDAIPSQIDNYGANFLDAATDNAVTNDYGSAIYALAGGKMSPSDNPIDKWDGAYKQLRYINLFLENGLARSVIYSESQSSDSTQKRRLRGEAYFLRAFWQSELLRIYGGVAADGEALGYPIVTHSPDVNNNTSSLVKRNTYEECAQQIFNDCDSAYKYLFNANPAPIDGRASAKAALALKSRMAVYAASEAYQPANSYEISPDSLKKKWQRAAAFSYDAINKGSLGAYSQMLQAEMAGGTLNTVTPADFLFRKYTNNNSLEDRNLPPSFIGNGRTNPSQNFVDAFPMANGYPIGNAKSNYNPNNPYSTSGTDARDSRLKLFVYYNGGLVETGGRSLQSYINIDSTGKQIPAADAPGAYYNNTRTGYYLKKWMSMKIGLLTVPKSTDFHMYPLLRKAEVYLNYAEASNMAGGPDVKVTYTLPNGTIINCDRTARTIIDDIRQKAGGISTNNYTKDLLSTDDFNTLILNERRLELAFENHRYFDLRRRLLKLNEDVRGMTLTRQNNVLKYTGTNPAEPPVIVEQRPFTDKHYYAPIPYDELVKSPLMKNNKGW